MRRLVPLTLVLTLLSAGPALATLGDEFGSEQQTEGYGRLFAYVIGAAAVIVIILVVKHVITSMVDESRRGRKVFVETDILDENPQDRKEPELYLGEKVPEWKIKNRLKATRAALKFLAESDEAFARKGLGAVALKAFRMVKIAIEDRTVKGLDEVVGPKAMEDLKDEIKKLKAKGELRIFGDPDITGFEIVQVEAPADKKNHTFTALISAVSKDYIADDRTKKKKRGDKKYYAYAEFWRFRRIKGEWLVERIRVSGDMDMVLEPKNVLTEADLKAFLKEADDEHFVREFVAK
ncbi:MAG TPA: hypothetical protein VM597_19745 [Gemmataceae bacterium]|jgi:hypothetical protein|nr:hypothetical protein [Gemmataceae bacterium]